MTFDSAIADHPCKRSDGPRSKHDRFGGELSLPALFSDDTVCPLHQRDKDRRASELCAPLIQVCFRDPTGPGTRSSGEDRNVLGDNFFQGIAKRGPSDRNDRVHRCFAHGVGAFTYQENSHIVTGFR